MDQSETFEVRIVQFSQYSTYVLLVFLRNKFHPEILTDSPSGGVEQWGVENKVFSSFRVCVNVSKTVRDRTKVPNNDQ